MVGTRFVTLAVAILGFGCGRAEAQHFNPATGHYYERGDATNAGLSGARFDAALVGGHLVTINDAEEQQWILETFGASDRFWIGLSDEVDEGVFVWDSGEPLTYTAWSPESPIPLPIGAQTDSVRLNGAGLWANVANGTNHTASLVELPHALPVRLQAVQCERLGSAVQIDWVNGAIYDSVEVYRNQVHLATLPGASVQYTDTTADAEPQAVYRIAGRVAGVLSFPLSCSTWLGDPTYRLSLTDLALAAPTGHGDVRCLLDSSPGIIVSGFSFGVCHDPALLDVIDIRRGSAIEPNPFFHSAHVHSDGFAVGVVIYFLSPNLLQPAPEHELYIGTYQPVAPAPATATLRYCNELGVPQVNTTVAIGLGGAPVLPVRSEAVVTIRPGGFQRADCNADGILNIADPVYLGNYLFSGGPEPACHAACDSNSDTFSDVADVVYAIGYLFAGGPTPLPPFPNCGPETLNTGLSCAEEFPCP
ncbi:MAG: C-type lectin domain-containing protein [Planctomycetota bacterium]